MQRIIMGKKDTWEVLSGNTKITGIGEGLGNRGGAESKSMP